MIKSQGRSTWIGFCGLLALALVGGASMGGLVNAAEPMAFPAEWEKHEAIWMGWPANEYVDSRPVADVQLALIDELAKYVRVEMAVNDAAEIPTIKQRLAERNIPEDRVGFHIIPHTDIWFRDMGPLFAMASSGELKVIDFNFNLWGIAPLGDVAAMMDNFVDRRIASELRLPTLPSSLVLEGGALEFNGRGTVITTESVVFDRNPGMTQLEVENELKRLFGIKTVIWIKEGLAEDDSPVRGPLPGNLYTMGTNGHIDEFARFVDAHTILLADVSESDAKDNPIAAKTRQRMDDAFGVLRNATDQDGGRFRIIRVPAAPQLINKVGPGDYMFDSLLSEYVYKDGSVVDKSRPINVISATSYLNFLVTNGIVLAPKYHEAGGDASIAERDQEVAALLRSCFPTRRVVQVDVRDVNLGGGGIHCITQQQPKVHGGRP
jgi:agmatine deiminase